MAICPHCKEELSKQNNGNLYCENCNKLFKVKTEETQAVQPETQQTAQVIEQTQKPESQNTNEELELLKARLAVVEAEKELAQLQLAQQQEQRTHEQQAPKEKSSFSEKASGFFTKVGESAAWDWCKSHWLILCPAVLLVIIFITLMSTLVGIRGIYVNVNDPNDFYSFTATNYVGYSEEFGESYEEKGTWKASAGKLTLTVKDEDFGKFSADFLYSTKNGYKTLFIGDDKEHMVEYKRVSLVKYDINTSKAKVTFDMNGGNGKNDTKKIKIGSMIKEPNEPTHPYGFDFMGWYTEPYGYKLTDGQLFDKDSRIWENTTYYANWRDTRNFIASIFDSYGTKIKDITLSVGDNIFDALSSIFDIQYLNVSLDGMPANERSYMPTKNVRISVSMNDKYCEQFLDFNDTPRGLEVKSKYDTKRSLTFISIPEKYKGKPVTIIGEEAFMQCHELTHVAIPNSIISIKMYAFAGCSKLTHITIPDSVTFIDSEALSFEGMTSVIIGKNVSDIYYKAFINCKNLTTVYYKGSAADWTRIQIYNDNNYLKNAVRYYYSEEEPTDNGNYWHYVDGVVTVWVKEN